MFRKVGILNPPGHLCVCILSMCTAIKSTKFSQCFTKFPFHFFLFFVCAVREINVDLPICSRHMHFPLPSLVHWEMYFHCLVLVCWRITFTLKNKQKRYLQTLILLCLKEVITLTSLNSHRRRRLTPCLTNVLIVFTFYAHRELQGKIWRDVRGID